MVWKVTLTSRSSCTRLQSWPRIPSSRGSKAKSIFEAYSILPTYQLSHLLVLSTCLLSCFHYLYQNSVLIYVHLSFWTLVRKSQILIFFPKRDPYPHSCPNSQSCDLNPLQSMRLSVVTEPQRKILCSSLSIQYSRVSGHEQDNYLPLSYALARVCA